MKNKNFKTKLNNKNNKLNSYKMNKMINIQKKCFNKKKLKNNSILFNNSKEKIMY